MKLKVKKLVSLNPDKYEFISLEKAIEKYGEYCLYYGKANIIRPAFKTFEQWLINEI